MDGDEPFFRLADEPDPGRLGSGGRKMIGADYQAAIIDSVAPTGAGGGLVGNTEDSFRRNPRLAHEMTSMPHLPPPSSTPEPQAFDTSVQHHSLGGEA